MKSKNADGSIPPDLDFPSSPIPLKPFETHCILLSVLSHGSFEIVQLWLNLNSIFNRLLKNDSADLTLMCHNILSSPTRITSCQRLVANKTIVTRLETLHKYKKVREKIFILRRAPNPHLIQTNEIFNENKNYQLHMVMKYKEQNLYQRIENRKNNVFLYPSLKSILAQLLVPKKNIFILTTFYGDIKPESILVSPSFLYFDNQYLNTGVYKDNYIMKMADFGSVKEKKFFSIVIYIHLMYRTDGTVHLNFY